MALLTNPKLLLYTRCTQILLSIIFFVLLCYSSVHRSWWNNINGAVVLGVFASVYTWFTTGYNIYLILRDLNPYKTSKLLNVIRMVQETIMILAWAGTAALMIKPKGRNWRLVTDEEPPFVSWTVGIVLAILEFLMTLFSALLVFVSRHGGSKSATPSYT